MSHSTVSTMTFGQDSRPVATLVPVPTGADASERRAWALDITADLIAADLLPAGHGCEEVACGIFEDYAAHPLTEGSSVRLAGVWNDQVVPIDVAVRERGATAVGTPPLDSPLLLGSDSRRFDCGETVGHQDVAFVYLDAEGQPAESGELWCCARVVVPRLTPTGDGHVVATIFSSQVQAVVAILETVQAFLASDELPAILAD